MSSRPTRGGRVTQTRRRVSASAPVFDSDETTPIKEVVSIFNKLPYTQVKGVPPQPLTTRPRADSDVAEPVGGGGKRQRAEDDGGTKGKEQLEGANVLLATKPLECKELLVTKPPDECNVDTEDKEQPATAKAARLKCKGCLYVFPALASAERHSSAVNPSGKAPPALWRCAPQAPDVSTLEEFKDSRVNTKYVDPAVVPLPPPPLLP